jgi:hypothetical protein
MSEASEWFDPSEVIRDSDKVIGIFGYWPTFHDAEIQEVRFSVGALNLVADGLNESELDMRIHLWEMTKEIDARGYYVLDKHTIAHLRFMNLEDVSLSNFRHQNSIFELIFGVEPKIFPYGGGPVDGPPPNIVTVEIDSSCGLSGKFKCSSAQVISAVPCDEDGLLMPTVLNLA